MKKFIYALAAAALLTGCVKEGAHEFDNPIGDDQIHFSTGMDVETRAPITGTAFAGGEKIGIFAVRHTALSTPAFPTVLTDYHMQNVTGTVASDGKVTLSGAGSRFWPESDYVDFYAYHPRTDADVFSYSAAPSLSITAISHTTDYLWADPNATESTLNKNKANASTGVKLTFKHAFSLVKVKVRLADDMASTSLSMSGFTLKTDASTNNQTGALNITTGLFTPNTPYASVNYPKSVSATITKTTLANAIEVDQIIFAPNTKITELTATLNGVTYTKTGLNDVVTSAATITNLVITITPTGLLFTASVTDWATETKEVIAS